MHSVYSYKAAEIMHIVRVFISPWDNCRCELAVNTVYVQQQKMNTDCVGHGDVVCIPTQMSTAA